jgi:dynactin-4
VSHRRATFLFRTLTHGLITISTVQLQKMEDQTPDTLELERLKDHFEPFLRSTASSTAHASASSSHAPSSSILAASSALHRDVPSLRNKPRYSGSSRVPSRGHPTLAAQGNSKDTDSIPLYRARGEARDEGSISGPGGLAEEDKIGWLGAVETLEGVAELEQRWGGGWSQSIRAM